MELIKEKKALFSALAGLVGVLTLLSIYTVFWGALSGANEQPTHTIVISSDGKTVAKPDVATFTFSVISEGKDTKAISDENNATIGKVIDALKAKGIDSQDIQTSQYNLYPIYSQPMGIYNSTYVPTIEKYSLTQAVRVKIRNFDIISDVLGSLASLGINQVSSLSFSIDNPETYRATARAQAIERAQIKADAMAKDLGVSLGKVVSVSEYSQDTNFAYQPVMAVKGMGGVAVPTVAPSIETGSQDVVANVTITYEIK